MFICLLFLLVVNCSLVVLVCFLHFTQYIFSYKLKINLYKKFFSDIVFFQHNMLPSFFSTDIFIYKIFLLNELFPNICVIFVYYISTYTKRMINYITSVYSKNIFIKINSVIISFKFFFNTCFNRINCFFFIK